MKARAGRGVIGALVLMFVASAALRLGDGLGPALAQAAGDMLAGPADAAADQAARACTPTPAALAAALSEREARMLAQESAQEDRAAALAMAETVMRDRLSELQAAEDGLRQTLAIADAAAETDLAHLTTVYEAMKPRDAAVLFDAMASDFAAGFLGRMRPESAGAVLAGMTPDKAYAVSAILAGRNALAPTE